jgi:hypothetical protein
MRMHFVRRRCAYDRAMAGNDLVVRVSKGSVQIFRVCLKDACKDFE